MAIRFGIILFLGMAFSQAHGDLILLSENRAPAVVYADGKNVAYLECNSSRISNSKWRDCGTQTPFVTTYLDFRNNFLRMLHVGEPFLGENPVQYLSILIEQLERTSNHSHRVSSLKAQLSQILFFEEKIAPKLQEGDDLFFLRDDNNYTNTIFAFHTLWFDGEGRVWRIGSRAGGWNDQRGACGKDWQTVTLAVFLDGEKKGLLNSPLMQKLPYKAAWIADRSQAGVFFTKVNRSTSSLHMLWSGERGVFVTSDSHQPQVFYSSPTDDSLLPILCWR